MKQVKPVDMRLRLGGWFGKSVASVRGKPPFEQVWNTYRIRVWGLTARLSGSKDSADDLTQEVAIQALRGYDNFRGDGDPMTWLFRIAIHTVVRQREKIQPRRSAASGLSLSDLEKGESHYLQVPATEQPENHLLNTEASVPIRRALDELPDELRTPLILHIYEEMKCREIAETLAIPLGTVLSRLHTARQRMKTALDKETGDEN